MGLSMLVSAAALVFKARYVPNPPREETALCLCLPVQFGGSPEDQILGQAPTLALVYIFYALCPCSSIESCTEGKAAQAL